MRRIRLCGYSQKILAVKLIKHGRILHKKVVTQYLLRRSSVIFDGRIYTVTAALIFYYAFGRDHRTDEEYNIFALFYHLGKFIYPFGIFFHCNHLFTINFAYISSIGHRFLYQVCSHTFGLLLV